MAGSIDIFGKAFGWSRPCMVGWFFVVYEAVSREVAIEILPSSTLAKDSVKS